MPVRSTIPGLVVARIMFTGATHIWMWTMHGRTADGSANTLPKMQGLADAIDAALLPGIAGAISTQQTYTGVVVADLSPALLPDATNVSAVVGTRAGSGMQIAATACVTKRTDQVGRAFRGRCYWSGGTSSDVTGNGTAWTAGYATAIQTQTEAVRAAFAAAAPTSYTPVLYHRAAGVGNIPPADSTTPITSVLGRTQVTTQRSRRT